MSSESGRYRGYQGYNKKTVKSSMQNPSKVWYYVKKKDS